MKAADAELELLLVAQFGSSVLQAEFDQAVVVLRGSSNGLFVLLLGNRNGFAEDELGALVSIAQQYPDLRRYSVDTLTGGLTFEFREGTPIGRFEVSGSGKQRLDALLSGETNLEFSSDDPDIRLTELHPLLKTRWGKGFKQGKGTFKLLHVPQVEHTVQHFEVQGQRFSLACSITRVVPRGQVSIVFGDGCSTSVSITLVPQGEIVGIKFSATVGFEATAHYDENDLELVCFLRAAIAVGHFGWYGKQAPQLGSPIAMQMPNTELNRPLAFIETFIEANRLLRSAGVLEQPLPWPDQDSEDLERIFEELQYVLRYARDGAGESVTVLSAPHGGQGSRVRDVRSGALDDAVMIEVGYPILGRVHFVRRVELRDVTVRFVGVKPGRRGLTFTQAVKRLGFVPEVEFRGARSEVSFHPRSDLPPTES